MNTNNKQPSKITRKPKSPWARFFPYAVIALSLGLVVMALNIFGSKTISLTEFDELKEDANITWEEVSVSIDDNVTHITAFYKDADDKDIEIKVVIPTTQSEEVIALFDGDTTNGEVAGDLNAEFNLYSSQYSDTSFGTILMSMLPWVFFIGFAWFMMSRMTKKGGPGGAAAFGKSKHRRTPSTVKFSDVAGLKEEKEELAEIVEYLKTPAKFTAMGAKTPKGVLLSGQPGTGKTLLAKAIAGEAHVPFLTISGSDFLEMFVGVGASRVRDMFKEAKKIAPCLIFIDEIDAIGRSRGSGMGGGNDEREQTLNQLLVEMDGFEGNAGVIVIAATNRPDILDPALMRSGRFDRRITVSVPDIIGREEILKVHARNKKIDPAVNLADIAAITPGFAGADLENIINEAALLAVRHNKKLIGMAEFDEAIDRVMAGPAKKSMKISPDQKEQIAYHEAGHAIVGVETNTNKVQKVTIIPRGRALGYVMHAPEEDKYIVTKNNMIDHIVVGLAGRAAEVIQYGEDNVSSGAQNDIEKATRTARAMVTQYGMSELGMIQFEAPQGPVFLARDMAQSQNFSQETATKIDMAVKDIIDEAYKKALKILKTKKAEMKVLVDSLINIETLSAKQIEQVLSTKKALTKEDVTESNKVVESKQAAVVKEDLDKDNTAVLSIEKTQVVTKDKEDKKEEK